MHLVLPVKLGHPGFFCGNLVAKLVSELLLFDSAFSKKVRAQEVDRRCAGCIRCTGSHINLHDE